MAEKKVGGIMGQGDKADAKSNKSGDDAEIERIIQEIEELEKTMEAPSESGAASPASATPPAPPPSEEGFGGANFDVQSVVEEPTTEATTSEETSVEPTATTKSRHLRVVEGDDMVPPENKPLLAETSTDASSSDDGLTLKVGGAAQVTLQFSRQGVTVTLECTDEGLRITTDQGAEFRLPFRQAA